MNEGVTGFFRIRAGLRGLVVAAATVACCATLLGFLGSFSWFLDLFSHFRVQYILGLSILALLLLVLGRRGAAVVCVAFVCMNLVVVLPLYYGREGLAPGGTRKLRVMLLNVNMRFGDPDRVRHVVMDFDPDILVLQEINSRWIRDIQWLAVSHPHARVQPREDNFGIGLFCKFPLVEGSIVTIGDAGVPSIVATVDTGDGKLRVIATHPLPPVGAAYSRWRNDQLDKLPDHVRSRLPVVLLGDLNVTPWNHYFKRLLERSGLIDSARGWGLQPTWPNHNALLRIPLDHCLHSPNISVTDRRVGPDVGSDHYPVIVDLAVDIHPLTPRGDMREVATVGPSVSGAR